MARVHPVTGHELPEEDSEEELDMSEAAWYERCMMKLSIRPILLLAYGGTVFVVFVVILLVSVTAIYTLRDSVLSESEDALKQQITKNAGLVLKEAGEVFEERIHLGLQTFVLPTAYAVCDAARHGSQYSIQMSSSCTDSSAETYSPPARLLAPLSTDTRFPCDMAEDAAKRSLRGCTAFDPAVPAVQGKKVSAKRSSVFLAGLRYDGANAQILLDAAAEAVKQTAVMDTFVKDAYAADANWQGAWMSTTSGGLLRQLPGQVGNLSTDAGGVRIYDPVNRFWFTYWINRDGPKTRMTNHHQDKYSVRYTAPYKSLFGDGFLISISVPVHNEQGGFLGVAGTDLRAYSLRGIVTAIRFRATGVAHLFHASTGTVAASSQWDPSLTSANIMSASDIVLKQGRAERLGLACSEGVEERNGYLISRQSMLDGHYCMAAVVPMDEILEPVERQRSEINSTADDLFVSILIVILISFFGFVMPCSCCIAWQISTPLINSTQESHQTVNNIGGDLLAGIDLQKRLHGVGEVLFLRMGFRQMLLRLKAKRDQPSAVLPANPAFGQLHEFMPSETRIDVKVPTATSAMIRADAPPQRLEQPSFFNQIWFRLILQLILPMFLAMLVAIIYSSVVMKEKSDEWVSPVKEMMKREEQENLKVRCFERAAFVTEILTSYENTLNMAASYSEALYNGELNHQSNYPAHFMPPHLCLPGATGCAKQPLEYDRRVVDEWGEFQRLVNFESSFWYAPGQVTAPPARHLQADTVYKHGGTVLAEQEGIATSLDNVARVAYFSSNITYICWGFENNEVYRQYPYEDFLTDQNNQQYYCNDGPSGVAGTSMTKYTPLCRDWYTKPRAAGGEVVYGTVSIGMDGKPFLGIGRGLYHSSGKFMGVVDVGINMKQLEKALEETPLYNTGFAYIFDKDGCAVLHRHLDESRRRQQACVLQHELSGAGDAEFTEKYRINIVGPAMRRETGMWQDDWYNEETGESETWYYAYKAIENTPYQLILCAVDREIFKTATELQDYLTRVTTRHAAITSAVLVIFTILLSFFSYLINNKLAVPIRRFGTLVARSTECGYTEDVEKYDSVWSHELVSLLSNFKKMLVALRFGNPAYHKGDKNKEVQNLRKALKLVQGTGNQRGIGVCKSNMANCVRGMDPQERSLLLPGEQSYWDVMQDAVENARLVVKSGEYPDLTMDTVGMRLLGLSLAQLEHGCMDDAQKSITEAVEIHNSTKNWQALARIAQVFLVQFDKQDQIRNRFLDLVKQAAQDSLHWLTKQQQEVEAGDAKAVGSLCLALFRLEGDSSCLVWALNKLPEAEKAMVCKLAGYAVEAGAIPADRLNDVLSSTYPHWNKKAGQKAIQFVLDASGSMAGSSLRTCKDAIKMIVKNNASDTDYVGFLAFAHYSKNIFPIMLKEGNEDMMLTKVTQVDTFGRTAFYDAVKEGVEILDDMKEGADSAKWLVALTDGADTDSHKDKDGIQACAQLKSSDINVAIITVGALPANTLRVVGNYITACQEAGCQGLHIVAHDTAAISKAFENIASMMDEGLDEKL